MKFKKLLGMFLVCVLGLVMIGGCSSQKPFEIRDITMSEAAKMMDEKQTFVLLFERDNCPFCSAMNEYIEKTKGEHPDLLVYRVDATSFELYRENEGDTTLISNSDDGKELLRRFPYYLYTPAIYLIKDGNPLSVGVGFDESKGTISVWDTGSTIQWDQSQPEDLYSFIAKGQASAAASENTENKDDAENQAPAQNQEDQSSTENPEEANPEGEGEAQPEDGTEAPVEGEPETDASVSEEEWDGGSEEDINYDQEVIEGQEDNPEQ